MTRFRRPRSVRLRPGWSAWLALALAGGLIAPLAVAAQSDAYVVLARHAEQQDVEDPDPALAEAGQRRAAQLAHVLSAWSIERVFASEYARTRDTAAPLARRLGVDVTVVEARDVEGLVKRIRGKPRPAVAIVGHSNTVPALIRALGVVDAPEIPEYQYDDLFVVRLAADGGAHLLHFKYGAPSPGH